MASYRARWVLTSAWLFLVLGTFWAAGTGPLTSGVLVAVVGLLPAMLLFALFTEGPSPRHEEVLHRVKVRP
ncbi:MAG TPA: hypothetical protein VGQ10_15225 [Vicinamibacterales bacterium]|jgi:hypothetical protein|nr:hypothetical protein [Vicinamibacterales bacterium]